MKKSKVCGAIYRCWDGEQDVTCQVRGPHRIHKAGSARWTRCGEKVIYRRAFSGDLTR